MPLKWFLIFLAVFVTPLYLYQFIHCRRHRRFRRDLAARGNAREIWQARFPDAMPQADKVLTLFADAFLLNQDEKEALRPDDAVMDIYKGTTGPIADSLELETFSMEIEKEFGLDLTEWFDESTTLGEIVERVVDSRQ